MTEPLSLPDLPPFRPRPPWVGGDLQTLRNFLVRARADLSDWPAERLVLAMADGTGDALSAALHRPRRAASRPLIVLVHGLAGSEDSAYVRATARHMLERSYPVLRLNLRGAGPSRETCKGLYHGGRSEDLAAALRALPEAATENGIVPVGYSLGGNMLLRFLAREAADFPVRAAAVVSAPIDLKASQVRLMRPRNRLYHLAMLRWMKRDALGMNLSDGERAAVRRAASVYHFDDVLVAPRGGFAGADDYYARCSGRNFLADIRVPTLVVHALDDPWIPADAYRAVDWPANPHLVPRLSPGGGHVGFHAAGLAVPWHDAALTAFLATIVVPAGCSRAVEPG